MHPAGGSALWFPLLSIVFTSAAMFLGLLDEFLLLQAAGEAWAEAAKSSRGGQAEEWVATIV
jgi:hypothetical protein